MCAAAFTNDGSSLTAGSAFGGVPAYSLGGVATATLNGTKSTMAFQFCMSTHANGGSDVNAGSFGNTPSSGVIVSDAASGVGNSLVHTPLLQQPPVLFSLAPGWYGYGQPVTLTSSGATAIYYTTDGSIPTVSLTLDTGPIVLNGTQQVNAIATGSGVSNSPITGALYTVVSAAALPRRTVSDFIAAVSACGQPAGTSLNSYSAVLNPDRTSVSVSKNGVLIFPKIFWNASTPTVAQIDAGGVNQDTITIIDGGGFPSIGSCQSFLATWV